MTISAKLVHIPQALVMCVKEIELEFLIVDAQLALMMIGYLKFAKVEIYYDKDTILKFKIFYYFIQFSHRKPT